MGQNIQRSIRPLRLAADKEGAGVVTLLTFGWAIATVPCAGRS
jgi:hypothetical protein